LSCPTCARGLSPELPQCPSCGAPNPGFEDSGSTRPDWVVPDTATVQTSTPLASAPSDILGFVVVYSESADLAGSVPSGTLGRVIPLRKGDLFFVGKAPVPQEVPLDGNRKAVPTGWHLFPFTEDFAHISRRHLVIEMDRPGSTTLVDLSTNGIYLLGEGRHHRRGKGESTRVHNVTGRESVVLGMDLGASTAGEARERALRYKIQIVPVDSEGTGAVAGAAEAGTTTTTRRKRAAKGSGA
jgi:hypothetical protein